MTGTLEHWNTGTPMEHPMEQGASCATLEHWNNHWNTGIFIGIMFQCSNDYSSVTNFLFSINPYFFFIRKKMSRKLGGKPKHVFHEFVYTDKNIKINQS